MGADAREVERGLKTDMRIGQQAYLRAGGPFAGGTLARDVGFVIDAKTRSGWNRSCSRAYVMPTFFTPRGCSADLWK